MNYKEVDGGYILLEDVNVETDVKPLKMISKVFYGLTTDGNLYARHGYWWNGASGPAIDTESTMLPSLVHDVLYQMIREKDLPLSFKDDADEELYRLMVDADDSWWGVLRSKYFYQAVSLFGGSSCEPKV